MVHDLFKKRKPSTLPHYIIGIIQKFSEGRIFTEFKIVERAQLFFERIIFLFGINLDYFTNQVKEEDNKISKSGSIRH